MLSNPDVGFSREGSAPRARGGVAGEIAGRRTSANAVAPPLTVASPGAAPSGGACSVMARARPVRPARPSDSDGCRAGTYWSRETVSSPPRARARRTCPRARGGGGDERDSGSNAARIPLSNPATRETREAETGDLGPGEGDLEGCRQPSRKKPSGECDLRRDPRPSPLTRARLGSETRVSRTTRTPSAYDGTPRPGTDERAPRVAVHNGPMRSDSKQTTHSSVRSPA